MNHLENLTKLRDTLKEKLAETESMRDYEAKYGSAGTAENLKDECKRLNESIDSLEWVIEQQSKIKLLIEDYINRQKTVRGMLEKENSPEDAARLMTKQGEYRFTASEIEKLLRP
mgnify:CR=1 FL=1